MEKKSLEKSPISPSHLLSDQIQRMAEEQVRGLDFIDQFSKVLSSLQNSTLLPSQRDNLKVYVNKLLMAKRGMNETMQKLQQCQQKLSKIRKHYKLHQKALVQKGPFYYKCVWQGGVRFRDYPKTDAKPNDDKMVTMNEVVAVDERVYISGEELVYLHVIGTGWLFESKEGIVALRRVPMQNSV